MKLSGLVIHNIRYLNISISIGYAAQGRLASSLVSMLWGYAVCERDVIDIFRFLLRAFIIFVKSLIKSGLTSPQDNEKQRVSDYITCIFLTTCWYFFSAANYAMSR